MIASSVLILLLAQQQTYDTLGRTQSQIFKMGRDAWMKVYEKEQGMSNQSMIHAYGSWAEAEESENDRIAGNRRGFISNLRRDLQEFCSDVTDISMALSGGGTMWFQIGAAQLASQEDALHKVLRQERSKRHFVVSDVSKLVAVLENQLRDGRKDLQPPFNDYPRYVSELEKAKGAYKLIVQRAAKLPRNESDTILGFCQEVISGCLDQGG